LLKSIGTNWVRVGFAVVVSFLLAPLLASRLGTELAGSWGVINAWLSWLTLITAGIPMASVRLFAQHIAKGDVDGLNRAIATVVRITFIFGALIGIGALLLYIPYSEVNLQSVPLGHTDDASNAFLISALLAVGGFAIQVPYGVLIAHGNFPLSNLAQIIALIGRFILNWIVLSVFTPSLTVVALANLAINIVDLAIGVAFVKWKHPNVTFVGAKAGPVFGSGIFSFSLYVLILLAGGKLTYSLDSIIISKALGDHEVLAFENGKMFVVYLTEIMVGIGSVMLPAAVKFKEQGRIDEIRRMSLPWIKIATGVSMLAAIGLLAFGDGFIARWMINARGFNHVAAGDTMRVFTISHIFFLPAYGVIVMLLMGLGKPKGPSLIYVAAGLLNAGLSIALVPRFATAGVAYGTAIANALFTLAMYVTYCREMNVGLDEVISRTAVKPLLGALPVAALAWWLRGVLIPVGTADVPAPPPSWIALTVGGVAVTAVFAVVWVCFVQRGEGEFDLWARWRRQSSSDS